jgi:membrane protein YqaA with SNARE-associated domain
MLNILLQNANRGTSLFAKFRHLGAFGLFALTILDSSPVPTFGGPDILLAILVSARIDPWYEYAIVAMIGSTIGAYITFRLARKAGEAYLESKFGQARVSSFLGVFKKYGTGTLVATTAVPFPFPTSLVFAAAGASDFPLTKYIVIVALSRGARYATIGLVADLFGRHFVRMFRHPTQYWGWFLLFAAAVIVLIGAGILINRRLLRGERPAGAPTAVPVNIK